MQIIKARYTKDWLMEYIDRKYERFRPVIRFRWIELFENLVFATTVIFIIASNIYLLHRNTARPWLADASSTYLMICLLSFFCITKAKADKEKDPRTKLYKKCFSLFAADIECLEEMVSAYDYQEFLQDYVQKCMGTETGAKQIIKDLSDAGIVCSNDSRICFTELDGKSEKYISTMEELEKECADKGLISRE